MTRTVTALYDTRAEAEIARARLSAQVNAGQVQILARDDVGGLTDIAADDARSYREALKDGGFLLVAEVPSGEGEERIVRLLKEAAADGATAPADQRMRAASPGAAVVDEVRIPQVEELLRIGKREVIQGGARVRTSVQEHPVREDVTLREEHLEAETRPGGRHLTLEDVQAAGLLKDRVIEVSAMREEAVITKQAVVREEVVLKKAISERVETIHDTVRRTEVQVEDLPRGASHSMSSGTVPTPGSKM